MVPRIASLLVALVLGACTKTEVPTAVPQVPLAQKEQDRNPTEEHKKLPRPRLIAPPPAYGNRVVRVDDLTPSEPTPDVTTAFVLPEAG